MSRASAKQVQFILNLLEKKGYDLSREIVELDIASYGNVAKIISNYSSENASKLIKQLLKK